MSIPPPLLLLARRPMSPAAIENLRLALQALSHEARPVVIDDGVDVYQLVDGRWVPVDPRLAPAPPDVLARDGITADGGPPCPDASPASSSCPSGSPSASPTAPPASSGS